MADGQVSCSTESASNMSVLLECTRDSHRFNPQCFAGSVSELKQLSMYGVCGMLHACGTRMLLAFECAAAGQPWGNLGRPCKPLGCRPCRAGDLLVMVRLIARRFMLRNACLVCSVCVEGMGVDEPSCLTHLCVASGMSVCCWNAVFYGYSLPCQCCLDLSFWRCTVLDRLLSLNFAQPSTWSLPLAGV